MLGLLLAGCNLPTNATPTVSDSEAGGGIARSGGAPAQPANPPGQETGSGSGGTSAGAGGAGSAENDADAGGGKSAPGAAPLISAAELPAVDLPAVTQGGSVQRGSAVLTLESVQSADGKTVIRFKVDGLPADFKVESGASEAQVQLNDGSLLLPSGGQGSGSPGSANLEYSFPPLPAGTQTFLLLLPNNWGGALETWRVPVNLGA